MAVSFVTRVLTLALGYPAHDCYKTLELNTQILVSNQIDLTDYINLKTYVLYEISTAILFLNLRCTRVLLAFLTAFERFADCAVSWLLPMYGKAKLALVV
ncbi:unnamed protein product [Urochloa humidicola]